MRVLEGQTPPTPGPAPPKGVTDARRVGSMHEGGGAGQAWGGRPAHLSPLWRCDRAPPGAGAWSACCAPGLWGVRSLSAMGPEGTPYGGMRESDDSVRRHWQIWHRGQEYRQWHAVCFVYPGAGGTRPVRQT